MLNEFKIQLRRFFFRYERKVVNPKLDKLDGFMRENKFEKIILIDCGANDGFISKIFMARFNCVKVLLIEPQTRLQKRLKKLKNYSANLDVLNACVSSKSGLLKFNQQEGGYLSQGGGSSYLQVPKGETSCYLVPAIGIEDILNEVREFKNNQSKKLAVVMKIDIEGAERHILPIIKEGPFLVDFIFCEFHEYSDDEIKSEKRIFNSMGTELEQWI